MPDNPLYGKAGNLTRAKTMLDYFQKNSDVLKVDFFSVKDWGIWNDAEIAKFSRKYPDLNLILHGRKIPASKPFSRIFFYKIPNFFHKLFQGTTVDISGFRLKKIMKKVIEENRYDIVIISYAVWGSMISKLRNKPYLINDTHDFITAQSRRKQKKIGRLFQSEMDILRKFDEIWTYSIEEEYIFEQFTDRKVELIPVTFPPHFPVGPKAFQYDIIYVASANPHNIAGIHWFLEKVLPLIQNVKIHIIGKICEEIGEYKNVIKHGMVDDLHEYYSQSKIAICPMLSGTGIKIKVIEALSYGIPVVTNHRGVDGLINKKENGCFVSDDPQIFAAHILKLLADEEFYRAQIHQAKTYFSANHIPDLEMQILNKTFR